MNNAYIPNTSAIPNILIDYWMPKLSPAEFKVLMCIARKTYGWHKAIDRISLRQIEEATGLSRKGITQNLQRLEELSLVSKIKSKTSDGDDAANQYEINVNCMEGGRELSSPQVVNSVHQGVVNSVHPQKKDNTKERLTKEKGAHAARSPSASSSKKEIERAQHVFTTSEEHQKLIDKVGIEFLGDCYAELSNWKIQTPKSKWKKCDYLSILKWVIDAVNDKKAKTNSKVVPGSFVSNKLPEDPLAKMEARIAVSDRFRRIVAKLCDQNRGFLVGGSDVCLFNKLKGYEDTFRYSDDIKFAKLPQFLASCFPEVAEEILGTNKAKNLINDIINKRS